MLWGRFLHDGVVAIDNNHIENLIRPWALGRKAWIFCGSELAGQHAAIVMSLVQFARLNGHEPWAYLKDVLERLLDIRTTGSTNCCRIVGRRRPEQGLISTSLARQRGVPGRLVRQETVGE